ncbi:Ldh family oxidoreductase [Shinella curvata]|uniref:Ldh family oxidoreductase n=1 Tax=Shinella curvata TaxID=1817964 RepID=A0ABT8XLQ8_9HYPH|nr:Ldh family oxidoreductase [Shinella curvata]MCJ8056841.1 Ldh family oxidoreductase [Shinella curvata]MDO6124176.1 Ldh family oxidoreductase [Shinella curvata]
MNLAPERLRGMASALLEARNVPSAHARLQADLLLEAELRGLPSHGLQRLPLILSRLDKGLADGQARGSGTWRRRSFLSVDGERGLGPVVLMHALEAMRPIVCETGIAIAAIRNANHIGMLAYYAEAAAKSGLIGIIMSTSEALVYPFGGTQAMLGTNPVAIGVPSGDQPFVLDLATSIVSMGKINHHAMRGMPIPLGWAVDAEGRPTTDANAARTGAIAPFGGAKGYGLGLAIELLVSALTGSDLAPDVRGTLDDIHAANKGDLLILIDAAAGDGSVRSLASYLDHLRGSHPSDPASPVAVPGDGARQRRAATERSGIELPQPLLEHLLALEAA